MGKSYKGAATTLACFLGPEMFDRALRAELRTVGAMIRLGFEPVMDDYLDLLAIRERLESTAGGRWSR